MPGSQPLPGGYVAAKEKATGLGPEKDAELEKKNSMDTAAAAARKVPGSQAPQSTTRNPILIHQRKAKAQLARTAK